MLTVAANFDQEPEIQQALASAPEPRDHSVLTLAQVVSPDAWERAERHASNLPFFVPQQMAEAPGEERLAMALGIVLHDHAQGGNPVWLVPAAMAEAQAMGLAGSEDAVLVIAAVQTFEGPQWANASWARDVRRERPERRTFIEAVRLRIALEHGRFV